MDVLVGGCGSLWRLWAANLVDVAVSTANDAAGNGELNSVSQNGFQYLGKA